MLVRLNSLWEQVRTGLWFLPLLMTLAAVALAWLTLGTRLNLGQSTVWWLHSGSASDAASLLSSLLASMITMATLAISITMVVLTLAANQLGPRLIRIFMADRRTQTMLGFFLATIVYVVLVLRSINSELSAGKVPNLAVSVGTAMVLACVFLLLFFINHLARSIVADTIINRIGTDLDAAAAEMLPDAGAAPAAGERPALGDGGAILRFKRGGYIEGIDHGALVECAREAGAVIDLDLRPGQHILPHGAHGRIHPAAALTDTLLRAVSNHVVLAGERTGNGDLEFLIRQLVEIALRALSPGVNDPFTAIAVIDRLGVSVASIMRRDMETGVWRDEEGRPRLLTETTTFRGLADVAFNQIRQAGEGEPAILIRLVSTLTPLLEQARDEEQRRVLREHIELVTGAGERSVRDGYDLAALRAVGPGKFEAGRRSE
ncbi:MULTISPECIES: DUF2254 domain-containing protein [Rhodomicrobium]|uniref:DUF2254 domain-containing protein n=1 Tax=Rhodomicrobium TaxID=1068 RepID=UPI0014836581|nr:MULTISPECIES: DUF2254 domain-containing protein [Rhodomicrobium]